MNNLLLQKGESLHLFALKSKSVSTIYNYKIIPFKDTNSDAACIARIIEIFRLNKLRAEGETLFSLTGLTVPDTEAVAEEINMLLTRCVKLCRHEEEELGYRQRTASEAESAMNQVHNARSISEVKSRGSRTDRADAERRYETALGRVAEQQTRVNHFRSLPGLLVGEAKHIGKGIDKALLHSFPLSTYIPSNIVSAYQNPVIAGAVRFITDALDEVTKAVSDIIKCCTPPVDKYELNNGGMLRALAYKEYYKAGNTLLRAIVTGEDYVNYLMEGNKFAGRKERIFSV
ncbi:hypothetical protein [Vagococcus sp. WN89Y]|uniref:hypothetical protein n=1 Tax=Vagococcus sp. WN89Y TaxID=3457258 RepID=UPI003ED5A002